MAGGGEGAGFGVGSGADPDADFRAELLAAFAAEYREHLAAIRGVLAGDGAGTGVALAPAALREVFRRAHSLKGAARAVDLPGVEAVAHRLEGLLARETDRVGAGASAEAGGAARLPPGLVALLERGLDAIEAQAEASAAGLALPGLAAVLAALDAGLAEGPAEGAAGWDGASGETDGGAVAGMGAALEGVPAEAPEAGGAAAGMGVAAEGSLRVEAGRVERLSAATHRLTALLGRGEGAAGLREVEAELRALRRGWEGVRAALSVDPAPARAVSADPGAADPGAASSASTNLGLASRLRGFEVALGEVARRVAGLVRERRETEDAVERAASALREEVEAIALVSAGSVLGPLAAAAREMAREMSRERIGEAAGEVVVRTEGMEAQAERRVWQALKDPVLHLLRNAVGHGAPRGGGRAEILLRVEAGAAGLTVTVRDNGPGPDLAAIGAAAVQRGLLAPGAAPAAEALLALVFSPGFSTAGAVDRLSGRGMGLSVVAEAVGALHGAVVLRPAPGGGAEVVIALPPSTGRRALLLVEAGGQVLGLPASTALVTVGPLLRLAASALTTAEGRPVARLALAEGEALVPVASLAALLGLEDGGRFPGPDGGTDGATMPAVLLGRGGARLLLVVDALRDARRLVVTEVDAPGVDPALVSGAALLEGEAVVLVLRPDALLNRGLDRGLDPGVERRAGGRPDRRRSDGRRPEGGADGPAEGSLPGPGSRGSGEGAVVAAGRRHVLVVDDSITTRTLERSILEAGGYRVTLAVDGADALNSLRVPDAAVDLVLADVEMPVMDGFGLLEAIRADPAFAGLPVVLMTSRDSPGDVQRGMELGADAYLTKQGFDQQALLATIARLV